MDDRELAEHRCAVCAFNEAEALRVARRAEAEWLAAVEAREGISVAQHRYQRAEVVLEKSRERAREARAALRSAAIESEVA